MFELSPLNAEFDQRRLCSVKLRLRLRHVQVRGHTTGKTVPCECQILRVGCDRPLEQVHLTVDPVELKIILRQFRLKEQTRVLQVAERCLCRGSRGGYAAVDV